MSVERPRFPITAPRLSMKAPESGGLTVPVLLNHQLHSQPGLHMDETGQLYVNGIHASPEATQIINRYSIVDTTYNNPSQMGDHTRFIVWQKNSLDQSILDSRPDDTGRIAILEILGVGKNGAAAAEYITIAKDAITILAVRTIPIDGDPGRARIFLRNNLPRQKLRYELLPIPKKLNGITEVAGFKSVYSPMFPSARYFHQHIHTIVCGINNEIADNPGNSEIAISQLFRNTTELSTAEMPVDAQAIAAAYKYKIALEHNMQAAANKQNTQTQSQLDQYKQMLSWFVPNSTTGIKKDNPWCRIRKDIDGNDVVEVSTNEAMMVGYAVAGDDVCIDLTTQISGALGNTVIIDCPSGGVRDGKNPQDEARREFIEEARKGISNIEPLGVVQATKYVDGLTYMFMGNSRPMTYYEEKIVASGADEQFDTKGQQISLRVIKELIYRGLIVDVKVIAAVALLEEQLMYKGIVVWNKETIRYEVNSKSRST